MKKYLFLLPLLLIGIWVIFQGINGRNAGLPPGEPISFAYLTDLSGPDARWGEAEVNGARMAVDDINATGGVLGRPLRMEVIDYGVDLAEALAALQQALGESGLSAVLGSSSSPVNVATAPLVEEAEIPQIGSLSSHPLVTVDEDGQVRPWSFHLAFPDPHQATVMAEFAYRHLGIRNAAILFDPDSGFSRALARSFERRFEDLGGSAAAWTYTAGEGDFSLQLAEIDEAMAELLYLPNPYEHVRVQASAAREISGPQLVLAGANGVFVRAPETVEEALEGSYWTAHLSWDDPDLARLKSMYRVKFGEDDPAVSAAMGYDSVLFLVDAIERAGSGEPADIRNAVRAARNITLKHATITIDPSTNSPANKAVVVKRVEGSHLVFYQKVVPY